MEKPTKPYADYPLFAHQNGQWAKKINGKLYYFGGWADHNAALKEYLAKKDYLYGGLPAPVTNPTVADLLDKFLGKQVQKHKAGDISDVTFNEYKATCDVLAAWGKHRQLAMLGSGDFEKLRDALSQGKTKRLGPVSLKRRLGIARMILKMSSKFNLTLDYHDELKSPPARILRQAKNATVKLYTDEQVRQIVDGADGELKAMVLLGLNCGFGPKDCCELPTNRVDLETGWHNFGRPKTGIERRCPLWPETVEALRACTNNGHVFDSGWDRRTVAYYFREFYTLRRTFETIATTAGVPQAVIDKIMGHVPKIDDMSAVYRQKIFDQQLLECTSHVRDWYLGKIELN
jgi:integrase